MKVLDLQCAHGHVFEGWFASEEDFAAQRGLGQLACPACGDVSIAKRLSAPRLNLASARPEGETVLDVTAPVGTDQRSLQAAWWELARRVVANTDDVGAEFPEVARKIHHGEVEERSIRGQATPEQTRSLIEEGIAVMPFPLPAALKGTLH